MSEVIQDPIQDLRMVVMFGAFRHARIVQDIAQGKQELSADYAPWETSTPNYEFFLFPDDTEGNGHIIAQMTVRDLEITEAYIIVKDNVVEYEELDVDYAFVRRGVLDRELAGALYARLRSLIDETIPKPVE